MANDNQPPLKIQTLLHSFSYNSDMRADVASEGSVSIVKQNEGAQGQAYYAIKDTGDFQVVCAVVRGQWSRNPWAGVTASAMMTMDDPIVLDGFDDVLPQLLGIMVNDLIEDGDMVRGDFYGNDMTQWLNIDLCDVSCDADAITFYPAMAKAA